MTEPTLDDLQIGNLRRMTDAQLDAEHAAVDAQAKDLTRDAYGRKLLEEYKRRGRKPPESTPPKPTTASKRRKKASS